MLWHGETLKVRDRRCNRPAQTRRVGLGNRSPPDALGSSPLEKLVAAAKKLVEESVEEKHRKEAAKLQRKAARQRLAQGRVLVLSQIVRGTAAVVY